MLRAHVDKHLFGLNVDGFIDIARRKIVADRALRGIGDRRGCEGQLDFSLGACEKRIVEGCRELCQTRRLRLRADRAAVGIAKPKRR